MKKEISCFYVILMLISCSALSIVGGSNLDINSAYEEKFLPPTYSGNIIGTLHDYYESGEHYVLDCKFVITFGTSTSGPFFNIIRNEEIEIFINLFRGLLFDRFIIGKY